MNLDNFKRVVEQHGPVVRDGGDWRGRCPAHSDDGQRGDLTFRQSDGKIVLHCWGGCDAKSVVSALGLRWSDLFSENGHGKPQKTQRPAKPQTVYPFIHEAVEAIAGRLGGTYSQDWTYRDASGGEVMYVVRFDNCTTLKGRKAYRPIHPVPGGFVEGDPQGPLPLYDLPEILAHVDSPVFICEGEKAADAGAGIGLLCSTSAHGAQSPRKTDWTPLAGRDCVILPDKDSDGEKYAQSVAGILSSLTPRVSVKIVRLPGLGDKGDLYDYIEESEAEDVEAICRNILDLAKQAGPFPKPPTATPSIGVLVSGTASMGTKQFPFPVESLPKPLDRFVNECASAIGCDPSYVALPLLVGLASAIGNSRRIRLKRGWVEPCIVWGSIVGESGTLKSPAIDKSLHPVRRRQHEAIREYAQAMEAYQVELMRYEKNLRAWKGAKAGGNPPEKPIEPTAIRYLVDDITVESLAALLQQNPRGLLLVKDELAGWIGSFDKYTNGKGSDASKWLEMFGGRSIVVDRKTGPSKIVYVHRAAVSVCGGIQPGILQRVLGTEHKENGLAARLLVTCPPSKAKKWTEADISPEIEQALDDVFGALCLLQPQRDENGEPRPVDLPLSPAAKQAWIGFYNEHAQEQAGLTGDLAASWSKLEGYAARLALIVHCARWAAGDFTLKEPDVVDEQSVEAGVTLSRWFGIEARRVYGILSETPEQRERRRLVEMIESRGGSVTVRDVFKASRRYSSASDAESALDSLAKAGVGHWEHPKPGPSGGRPTRQFVLTTCAPETNTPSGDPVNRGFGDSGKEICE
ncbi:MAG TPA: DUF3987 domain-containing protein [Bacillota bacterium]|jgi:hypothetical protein|nr:DUF3987 domain-containing protein [Verrucomicrobiota bacterium]HOI37446.1 DUF3987 domain-containing protein [Bacillota bacterium]